MSKRRRRRHRDNRGRRRARRTRRVAYNRRRKGGYRRKAHKRRRKCGAYACFVKAMWRKHRAAYKRLGVGAAGRQIAKAWKKRK